MVKYRVQFKQVDTPDVDWENVDKTLWFTEEGATSDILNKDVYLRRRNHYRILADGVVVKQILAKVDPAHYFVQFKLAIDGEYQWVRMDSLSYDTFEKARDVILSKTPYFRERCDYRVVKSENGLETVEATWSARHYETKSKKVNTAEIEKRLNLLKQDKKQADLDRDILDKIPASVVSLDAVSSLRERAARISGQIAGIEFALAEITRED